MNDEMPSGAPSVEPAVDGLVQCVTTNVPEKSSGTKANWSWASAESSQKDVAWPCEVGKVAPLSSVGKACEVACQAESGGGSAGEGDREGQPAVRLSGGQVA